MQTWCITCSQTPERKTSTEKHLRNNGILPNWWFGFHGKTWGLEPIVRGLTPKDRMSIGHIGLNLSYWALWQHLLYENHNEFLIFEDDVIVCNNFQEEFDQCKIGLPTDWQFVYIGHIGLEERELPELITKRVAKLREYPVGTHATLVHRSALPILLEENQRVELPIDEQLAKYTLPKLKVYAFVPSLANQRSCIDWPSLCAQ